MQLTFSKFIATFQTFKLSLIRSVCYTLFQSGKVIGKNRSDEQKYIVDFCIEEFYSPTAKVIHLQNYVMYKTTFYQNI